jgi:hypothetical protein
MKYLSKSLYWLLAIGAAIVCFLSDAKEIKIISGVIAGLLFGIGWVKDIQNVANEKSKHGIERE